MVAAALVGLALGYLLGLRMRVLVLLPVEMAAVAAAVATTLSGAAGGCSALLHLIAFSVGLQASYMLAVAMPFPPRRPAAHPAEV